LHRSQLLLSIAARRRRAAVGVPPRLDDLLRVDAEPLGRREHRRLPVPAVDGSAAPRQSGQHFPREDQLLVESVSRGGYTETFDPTAKIVETGLLGVKIYNSG